MSAFGFGALNKGRVVAPRLDSPKSENILMRNYNKRRYSTYWMVAFGLGSAGRSGRHTRGPFWQARLPI